MFVGLRFAIVLERDEVRALKKSIIANEGSYSYLVTPDVTHVISDAEHAAARSHKIVTALELGIPVLRSGYVEEAVRRGKRLAESNFSILGAPESSQSRRPPRVAKTSLRVFVSSTFSDMTRERELLESRVFPAVRALCRERHVAFSYVDLRWGVGGEENGVLRCLEEVDACRPLFLCMLGERYGWIPSGAELREAAAKYPWLADCEGRSITELEVLHGALRHASEEGQLFFLRDPYFLPVQEQEASSTRLLSDLKRRVRESGACVHDKYRDPEEFARLALEELTRVVERECPADSFVDPLDRELASQSTYAELLAHESLPRPTLSRVLTSYVRNSSEGAPLLLYAQEGGCGQSTLLAQLVQTLESRSELTLVAHFSDATTGSSDARPSLADVMRRVLNELSRRLGTPRLTDERSDEALMRDLNMLLGVTCGSDATSKVCIVLDGMSRVENASQLALFPQRLPENVRLVISMDESQVRMGREKWPSAARLLVPPFQQERVPELAACMLRPYGKSFTKEQTQLLVEHAPRAVNPLHLRILLDVLRAHASFESLRDAIVDFGSSARHTLLAFLLAQLEKEAGKELVADVLRHLCAARNGSSLAPSELQSLCRVSSMDPRWYTLRRAAAHLLVERNGMITFFHPSLRAVARKRYRPSRATHQRMGAYFASQHPTFRVAREQAYHLAAARVKGALTACLADLPRFSLFFAQAPLELIARWQTAGAHLCCPMYEASLARYKNEEEGSLAQLATYSRQVGRLMLQMGLVQDAVPFFEQAADAQLAIHGRMHQAYAQERVYLGDALLLAGKYGEALAAATEALDVLLLIHGSEHYMHVLVGESHALLGRVAKKQANYDVALSHYQQALAILSPLLGTSHPQVAHLLVHLGDVHRKLGAYNASIDAYLGGIRMLRLSLGPKHPELAGALRSLALVYKKNGQYVEAERLLKRAIAVLEGAYGDMHPQLGEALVDYADVHRKLEELEDALALYERATRVLSGCLGPKHPDVADALNSTGLVLKKQGKYEEARACYARALAIVQEHLSPTHYKYGQFLANLGDVQRKEGDIKGALESYARAKAILVASLGSEHEEVASLLNAQGLAYKKLQSYAEASACLKEALRVVRKAFSARHHKVGVLLTNLGDVYRKQKKVPEAHASFTQAISILEESLGLQSSELVDPLTSLGIISTASGDYALAKQYLLRADAIVDHHYGAMHAKHGLVLNRIGELLAKSGDSYGAAIKFQEALSVLEQTLGRDHVEVADVLVNLARASSGTSHLIQRALEIVRASLGPDHPKVRSFSQLLEAAV